MKKSSSESDFRLYFIPKNSYNWWFVISRNQPTRPNGTLGRLVDIVHNKNFYLLDLKGPEINDNVILEQSLSQAEKDWSNLKYS